MFWIKAGQQCFPGVDDKSQAVLITVEQFVLPLANKVDASRQVQNERVTKLIAVANTQVIVDFMTDLFTVVTGDIFVRYTFDSQRKMSFDHFHAFARDHDIFPALCSQAALYRIFHSLSHFSEVIHP